MLAAGRIHEDELAALARAAPGLPELLPERPALCLARIDRGALEPRRSPSTLELTMKTDIHPEYVEAHVRCTCGNEFTTRSTKGDIHVEICSNCHPFYTGKQKLVDTGGRVERFQRRAAKRRGYAAPCS